MNPYTYHRRVKSLPKPAVPGGLLTGGLAFAREVLNASITPLVAFAVVMLGAVSVLAITVLATPEISADYSAIQPATKLSVAAEARVLGESIVNTQVTIVDDLALEALEPTGELMAKPLSYDSSVGRWDYLLSYKVANLSTGATLSIGSQALAEGITASGTLETGAILKPNTSYRATLWTTDAQGQKIGLARVLIKTPKASANGKKHELVPCPTSGIASSTPVSGASTPASVPCVKNKDGKMICAKAEQCKAFLQFGKERDDRSTTTPPRPPKNSTSSNSQLPPKPEDSQ